MVSEIAKLFFSVSDTSINPAKTGFYYLNSRYYDPEGGRFISADTTNILGVSSDLYDKNLYAYCDNNPVIRKDITGYAWETVFDVVSLGASVMEAVANPANVWNWVGLAGDTLDLIPFVTGLGESTRLLKAIDKVDYAKVVTVGSSNKIGKMGESFVGINQKAKKSNT